MDWFEERLWPDWAQRIRVREVLYRSTTAHQDLIVFESPAWGRVLALDGVVQTTTMDEFVYHEMLVHVPLLAHGHAEEVLIVGGGDGGCLREVLRHPGVRRVTQVEIDASVIELCKRFLPSLSDGAFDDPRAEIVIADGAAFARETARTFDVAIVDSTDPLGPGEVLFSEAFYRDLRARLRPGGVMTTQCGNPVMRPDELENALARQRAAGFALVDYYFAAVPTYVGGNMALGFATDDLESRRLDAADLAARGVPAGLRYYTPEMHVASFAHPAWLVGRTGL